MRLTDKFPGKRAGTKIIYGFMAERIKNAGNADLRLKELKSAAGELFSAQGVKNDLPVLGRVRF